MAEADIAWIEDYVRRCKQPTDNPHKEVHQTASLQNSAIIELLSGVSLELRELRNDLKAKR